MNTANPIRNVSDTALWVAIYRAMESERADAIFNDPYARRLGGARGEAIVESIPGGKGNSWPMVVRTAVMDEIVMRCVEQGVRTVLNLAAGLDARPYRLPLPPTLRWLHVDLPDMIDYFRANMAGEKPRCTLEFVAADLREKQTRQDVFTRAGAEGPLLVITEGLLIYLEDEEVADIARDLHAIAHARWWLTDLATPLLLKILARRWQPKLANGNAPFKFGPADSSKFFEPLGWHETEFRSTWDESLRLNRSIRGARFWRFISLLQSKKRRDAGRRMSGIVLFESGAADDAGGEHKK